MKKKLWDLTKPGLMGKFIALIFFTQKKFKKTESEQDITIINAKIKHSVKEKC